MNATKPQTLYSVIEERRLSSDRLPTAEELTAAADALHAVQEFLTDNIVRGCVAVANTGEPNAMTYEDIGRLVLWADMVRGTCSTISDDAAKVMIVAREGYQVAEGGTGDGVPYGDYGDVAPSARSYEAQLRRRYGLSHAS